VEIPAGSAIKYELHEASGRMEVDRFLAMPMAYPANYGIFPCTLAEDGDALDVLVLTRAPVLPGAVLRVRPVGVLRMLDRGEEDDKILAVPVDAVDATFAPVRELADLAPAERDRIEAFFRVYKNLPDPGVQVEVGPWEGRDAALAVVREALAAARVPER
jgi:inorganic pyrophosphatase